MSRPAQCRAVLERMLEKGCTTPVTVFVNGVSHYDAYVEELITGREWPEGWRISFHPENLGAIGALNYVFRKYPDEKFYGFVGDDEFVETVGFDKRLIDAAGDWDFSHGHIGNGRKNTAQGGLCIGGELARALGYLAMPSGWHWFALDNMWEVLAEEGACRNVFCDDVIVEHRHPYYGKGSVDRCYKLGEVNAATDHYEFSRWIHYELAKVVARIKKAKVSV